MRPGDGIIHTWLNRMLLPDQVGTGADSHTRFPLGISFPGGSGVVAFAAAWQVYAGGFIEVLVGAGFLGAFVFTLYSLSAATANDHVTSGQRVQVAGALLITYGAGAVIGPIAAAQFMSHLGPQGLFFYIALIELVLCSFSILTRKRRVGSADKRKPFVVVPSNQATSSQLYVSAHDDNPDTVTSIDKTSIDKAD